MNTEELIATLAEDVPAVPRHAVGRRLALGLVAGGVVSLALICLILGVRPDLWDAMHGSGFWMKWSYTLSLCALAVAMTLRLATPDGQGSGWFPLLFLPVVLLAAVGIAEMAQVPSSHWLRMWLGDSWTLCSGLVLMFSLPIFIGLLWSFRRLAPTRLREAGATAGLAAGACAATLYCVHCPEVSAIFVLTWYTLGIALAAAFGALVGPRLMRW